MPTSPSATYAAWDSAPYFGPSSAPAMNTNSTCRVNADQGVGMRMYAPTAVSAQNSADRISILVGMWRFDVVDAVIVNHLL